MSVLDKISIGKLIEIEQPRFSRNLGGPAGARRGGQQDNGIIRII
jgi:hypothetical protein